MNTRPAGELHGGLVRVIGGIEYNDLIAGGDQRLHGREDRLGGTKRHRDLELRIDAHRVTAIELGRNRLAQLRHPRHRRVLIMTLAHSLVHQFADTRIDVVIRKSLAEVHGLQLGGTLRHDGEDGGADPRQLAANAHVIPGAGSCASAH